MIKLLPILFLCFLFSSCAKVSDLDPEANTRFEVSCNDCTISISDGIYTDTYDVQGYMTIPYDDSVPRLTVSLWTYNDSDYLNVQFVGRHYTSTVYDNYLYYSDYPEVINFNL